MKIKKKELDEIIDGDGNLIGSDGIPSIEANADTHANKTTDYNAKVGTQPFRYDMLGRFGFSMMPFMEGKESQEQSEMLGELINLMYDRYVEILKHYYKNPNKLKIDYRKISASKGDPQKEVNVEYANKIISIVSKTLETSLKTLDEQYTENIAESVIIEDKMVDKKDNDFTTKSKDNGVREKRIEKIAGLINKLEKGDIDKLINLLEGK